MLARGRPQHFWRLSSLHWRFVLVAAIASMIGLGRAPAAEAARLRDPAATELDAALALLGGQLRSTEIAAAVSVAGAAAKSIDEEDAGGGNGVIVGGGAGTDDYDSDDRGALLSPLVIDGDSNRQRAEIGGSPTWRRQRLLFGSRERVEHGAHLPTHGALGAFFGYSNGAVARQRKGPGCAPGQFAGAQAAAACRLGAGEGVGAYSGATTKEREMAAVATRRPTLDLKRWNNAVMRLWGKRGGGGGSRLTAAAGARLGDVYNLDSLTSSAR